MEALRIRIDRRSPILGNNGIHTEAGLLLGGRGVQSRDFAERTRVKFLQQLDFKRIVALLNRVDILLKELAQAFEASGFDPQQIEIAFHEIDCVLGKCGRLTGADRPVHDFLKRLVADSHAFEGVLCLFKPGLGDEFVFGLVGGIGRSRLPAGDQRLQDIG